MVPHSKGVHRRPQPPARPLPDVRVHLPGDDQRDQVADLRGDDGAAAQVGAVAQPGEGEDDEEGEEGADGREGVGRDCGPAEGAGGVSLGPFRGSGGGTYTMMDGV